MTSKDNHRLIDNLPYLIILTSLDFEQIKTTNQYMVDFVKNKNKTNNIKKYTNVPMSKLFDESTINIFKQASKKINKNKKITKIIVPYYISQKNTKRHILWKIAIINNGYILIGDKITKKLKNDKQLLYNATHDGLTNIYNRAYFEQSINNLKTSRCINSVATVMFDADGLKTINDIEGHKAGDDLLKKIAHIINTKVRSDDIFARIGGDEFALLLPNISDINQINILINRIQFALGKISLSVGFDVAIRQLDSFDIEKSLEIADHHMYEMKNEHHKLQNSVK